MFKTCFFITVAFAIASAGFLSPNHDHRGSLMADGSWAADEFACSGNSSAKADDTCRVAGSRRSCSVSETAPRRIELVASLHTEELMRSYLLDSLAPVPAMMFAPAALQLSFAASVNQPLDEPGNTYLHLASRSGDPYFTWQLLEFGANPRLRNYADRRPLDVLDPRIAEAEQYLLTALNPASPTSPDRRQIATRNLPFKPLQKSDTETAHQTHEKNGPDSPAVI